MAFVMRCVKHFNGSSIGEDRRTIPQPPWEQSHCVELWGGGNFWLEFQTVPKVTQQLISARRPACQLSKKNAPAGRRALAHSYFPLATEATEATNVAAGRAGGDEGLP